MNLSILSTEAQSSGGGGGDDRLDTFSTITRRHTSTRSESTPNKYKHTPDDFDGRGATIRESSDVDARLPTLVLQDCDGW